MRINKTAKLFPPHSTYKPLDLIKFDHPAVRAARPMVGRILTRYGLNIDGSARLAVADAIRDSGSRREIHPHPPLHPNGTTAGLMSVPAGFRSWATLNALWNNGTRANDDNAYWNSLGYDALTRWQILYGTLDIATGNLAGNGMLAEIEPGFWQVKDPNTFKTVQCSHQHIDQAFESAAVGIPGLMCSTIGHDGYMAFIAELNQWVWECRTYNESFVYKGTQRRLTPQEIINMGQSPATRALIERHKIAGPNYDPEVFMPGWMNTDSTYFSDVGHLNGMTVFGTMQDFNHIGVPLNQQRANHIQAYMPDLPNQAPFNNPAAYPRASFDRVLPHLGVGIVSPRLSGDVSTFGLAVFNWPGPGPFSFERRVNGGAWSAWALDGDTIKRGIGTVDYRAKDSLGFYTGWASVTF